MTQYSATPPPGVKATRVDTGAPLPAAEVSDAEAKARRLVEETNRRADERTREEVARAARDDAADRLQRRARGREQLDTVLRGGPVFHYNDRGEKVYLEDSARDAEIARLRSEVRAMCTGVPSTQDAATRTAAPQADRMRECALARERVRALESGGSHIPTWMIEEARARAGRICASPAN